LEKFNGEPSVGALEGAQRESLTTVVHDHVRATITSSA
jgi:hypothetical protein